jgi:hypothetical protein
MTHGHLVELAGRIAQHGTVILKQCRGIPVAGLKRYLEARKSQCADWSHMLVQAAAGADHLGVDSPPFNWQTLWPVIEEISTSSILLRVSGSLLHGIGEQLDIPFAIDVASRSARAFDGVVQRVIGFIALRNDLSCSQLVELDRLGQMADRMSDLLCGALLPASKCDRYFVDRERARDFAETFGRNSNLVQVSIQRFSKRLPQHPLSVSTARDVVRSLVACLPVLANLPESGARPIGRTDKAGGPIGLRVVGQEACQAPPKPMEGSAPKPVSFPSHSFARSRQRLRDSAHE